ncbi:MAG: hypothetical protein O7G87_09370 [bacterium]|nr:hypothetical protein [bacterium]
MRLFSPFRSMLWAVLSGFLLTASVAFSEGIERAAKVVLHEDEGEYSKSLQGPSLSRVLTLEPYARNTEMVSRYKPDSVEDFADLYVSGDYVYLGNYYDGLRVIDVSTPEFPRGVGLFPKPQSDVRRLVSGQGVRVNTDDSFLFPSGVVLEQNGDVLVADVGRLPIAIPNLVFSSDERDGAIYRVDRESGAVELVFQGAALKHPLSIARTATGLLVVANVYGEQKGVYELNPRTGSVIPLLVTDITFPYGVAIDALGGIYVSDAGDVRTSRRSKLLRFDRETEIWIPILQNVSRAREPFYSLRDIIVDRRGLIIAIDAGDYRSGIPSRILEINPDSRRVRTLRTGSPLHSPVRLALGVDGQILIADFHADPNKLGRTTGAIFQLDPETGRLTTQATGDGVYAPFGLASGQAGEVIWTNATKRTEIKDIKVSGHLAVVSNEVPRIQSFLDAGIPGIQILDISDPTRPVELAKYTTNLDVGGVHNSYISGDWVYLVSNTDGIRIVNIADPQKPFEVGHWAIPESEQTLSKHIIPHDVSVLNHRAYVSYAEAGFRVLDVSNPRNPTLISKYTYPGAWTHSAEPSADGNRAFITDEKSGGFMRVIDLSDLANPRQIGFYKSSNRVVSGTRELSIHNVRVEGDLVYVGNYQDGFRAVDVSDPARPREVGAYILSERYRESSFNGAWSAFPHRGLVYVSDLEHGLFVLRFHRPLAVVDGTGSVLDFDEDGEVGFSDFLLFAEAYGSRQEDDGFDARFDLDGNGNVGFGDFLIFAKRD